MTKISKILEPLTPKTFDKNEIFVLVIVVLCVCILVLVHHLEPHLLQTEIIALFVFNILFGTIGDRLLAEPPFDFYNTLDYGHGEFFDSILQIVVYPIPIILFIHFYRKWKPNKIVYILLYALLLAGLEWISAKYFDVFQFNTWNISYSYVFYCFVLIANLIFVEQMKSRLIK
ncbi:hypothetical protein FGG79_11900 [Bacillus sp. BHET2]|uniref:hypothetical protein n=1 Tax=Bacillus sp. BHET2 TaxID=2583818 RepID=UPI00110E3075|nr:hypothetical protein [Bacillus sp. BHET2]TMU85890.1 hypothetical protein FGG79_11900 [Bacillus sp. BHET2]